MQDSPNNTTALHPHADLGPICVAALYQFARFPDFATYQPALLALCEEQGIKGTLLLAHEGINGTIAGSDGGIEAVLAHIRALPGCADVDVKLSRAQEMPFNRMKVRLKREIVTMGEPDTDPLATVGTYIEPQDWNALISDPDTILIDTRNDYEVAVGTFSGAIDPKTHTFREFPKWFREHREQLLAKGKETKVAMFCTGGIRCEKSTSFLKQEGVDNVFHLKGGILKYLETVPQEESLWEGECFVFDQRVTIGHGLVQGQYKLCFACRRPITDEDTLSPLFEQDVSCPKCYHERTDKQRAGYRERAKQEKLAAKKGVVHVGTKVPTSKASDATTEEAQGD